jgi:PHD/YefM family antitoxin component YafN of YafNO toxin-antitoxin module
MSVMSSREFNQDRGKAKKLTESGPVIITDRGKPSYVLLSYDAYAKLTGKEKSIAELLAVDDDIDFDPPKLDDSFLRPAEFD